MQTQIVLLQRITVLQLCNISWSCLCGDGKTYQLGCKTEDEMVWHHQLDGYEFEQVPEVGVGQGGLAYYSPWGCKELDMTERMKGWSQSKKNTQLWM